MKVLLRESIENLGKKGDVVNVAPGFGRNFLIPKKIALEVTASNYKMVEIEQKALKKGLEKEMKSYQGLIARLDEVTLSFVRKAGDKDSIFGSVTVTDIKEELDRLGFDVEKKRILLEEPIKRLGNYTVPIKIFHEEKAEISVHVVKQEEKEKQEKEEVEEREEAVEEEKAAQPEEHEKSEPPLDEPKDKEPGEKNEKKG